MKCRTPVSTQIIKIKDEIKNQFSKKVNDTEIIEKLNQSIINTEEKFNGTSKYYIEI